MSKAPPIAHVEAAKLDPNGPPMTLAQFAAWRREEDARMLAELEAQILAHIERLAGATIQ